MTKDKILTLLCQKQNILDRSYKLIKSVEEDKIQLEKDAARIGGSYASFLIAKTVVPYLEKVELEDITKVLRKIDYREV